MYDSAFAALYYPWIKVDNPIGTNGDAEVIVPPSRPHRRHLGPHRRHPRRLEGPGQRHRPRRAGRRDATSPRTSRACSTRSASTASARSAPAASASGAPARWRRTPTGRYINVRRLFNMIETTIMNGTQFAVFEPNDDDAVGRRQAHPGAFLRGLWRDGALFGATAEQAFYVKCDAETNPPESIDQGKVDRRGRHRAGQAGRVRHLPHRPDSRTTSV